MGANEIFRQKAEDAVAKQRKATNDFALRIIPTVLWCVASILTAVNAFNGGEGFYIVTGIISVIGSVVFAIKIYKDFEKSRKQ